MSNQSDQKQERPPEKIPKQIPAKIPAKTIEELLVDPDIQTLSLQDLRLLYMKRRNEARSAMTSYSADDNDSCWDGLIKTTQNLLPDNEQTIYKLGKFTMCGNEFLHNCRKFVDHLQRKNKLLPNKKCSLE